MSVATVVRVDVLCSISRIPLFETVFYFWKHKDFITVFACNLGPFKIIGKNTNIVAMTAGGRAISTLHSLTLFESARLRAQDFWLVYLLVQSITTAYHLSILAITHYRMSNDTLYSLKQFLIYEKISKWLDNYVANWRMLHTTPIRYVLRQSHTEPYVRGV